MWLLILAFVIGFASCDVYHLQPQSGAYNVPQRGHYIQQAPALTAHQYQQRPVEVVNVGYQQQPQYYPSSTQSPVYYRQDQLGHISSPILRYENTNNGDGNYRFAYETANGLKQEEQGYYGGGTGNVVRGFYSYVGPNNKVYTVHYYADATGFHASGDHIPTSS